MLSKDVVPWHGEAVDSQRFNLISRDFEIDWTQSIFIKKVISNYSHFTALQNE